MKKWFLAVLMAAFLGPGFNSKAAAAIFDLVGVEDSNLGAIVDFTYDSGTGLITVSITNNTSLLGGPDARITAFAFNLPADVSVSSFETLHEGWDVVAKNNGIDTPGEFGFYDVAGITGSNYNGGKPSNGIPPGSTFTFQFQLAGAGLVNVVTEFEILSLMSYSRPNRSENVQYFIGRFQRTGMDGEGSDVAIPDGQPSEEEPEEPQDPEPEPEDPIIIL